jgi:peptidoglycan/xylan/chitin deacetylase (PgdA/CDA1 family)
MDSRLMRFGVRLISHSGLLSFIETQETRRENLLRILVYHRIGSLGEDNGLMDPSLLSATPDQFEQQMKFLREHYRLLSILDLLQAIEAKESLPPKSVMVTFDDGYLNFFETAWPILQRFEVPTLVFLATGFLFPENQIFWWDRLYQGIYKTSCTRLILPPIGSISLENKDQRWDAFIKLKNKISCMSFQPAMQLVDQIMETLEVAPDSKGLLMNWSDVRLLNEQGCYLAAHTRNHPILTRITRDEAHQEIMYGQQDILKELGTACPVFAYPSGHQRDINNAILPILQELGFKLALTSIPGINVMPHINPLRLERIGLFPGADMTTFRLVLTRIYRLYCMIQAK